MRDEFGVALRSPAAAEASVLISTVELPPHTDLLCLWEAFPDSPSAFFEDGRETIAGSGVCSRGRLPDGIGDLGEPGDSMPRLLGAQAFAPEWFDQRWAALAEHGFVLPRWTILKRADRVRLQLAVAGPVSDETIEEVLSECDRLTAIIEGAPRERPGWIRPRQAEIPPGQDEETWRRAVDSALRAIDAGGIQKVVLSRHVTHGFADAPDASALLRHLSETDSGRYRFGLRIGGTAFVGASPECLFEKCGSELRVEALAGTFDIGDDPSPQALVRATEHLFASGKDLEEHALVVRGITDALVPLCESVTAADWPEVREARGLAHLSSQVTARLRPGVSAFDLIDALHPTPAVGGLPVSRAVDFIMETEKAPRGLFAAPVGWIGADGDARLAVAIRAALLHGSQADVYAGAGIVSGSDPGAEWTETGAKLRWLAQLGSGTG